jgi:YidC/Oxa1 family membrane protein insertase
MPPRPAVNAAASVTASPALTASAPAAEAAPSPTASTAASPTASVAPTFAEKTETLRNGDFEVRLTNRGGAISEVTLLNHTAEKGQRVVLNSAERMPVGAFASDPISSRLPEFTASRDPDGSVVYEGKTAEGLTVRKKFSLPPPKEKKDNFLINMEVELRNDAPQPYSNDGFFVTLGSTTPIHPNDMPSYTRVAWCVDGKAKGVDVSWFAAQNYPIVGVQKRAAQEFYTEKLSGAEWAGTTNQFFTTLLTPLTGKATEIWARRFDVKRPDAPPLFGIEGAMRMAAVQLQPAQASTMRFQIWAGPKLYGRLATLEHDEAEIMNFGMWKLVSQFLLNLMNWIHRWVGNYAVAILLLTALVKGILWPLQNRANKSMRRMSALSPKMQELREKYKDDPTRMNQEVMKLYKEYGVNPVGGCLPMAIQIPIFFGLFSMLGQAVELRNASFLWVRDLSQPDTVGHIPGLGFPINILPLIMGATNVWLMRMTPKTGDTTQQKVMMFMPLIFLFFCYNFAAALALYYATQNLFTILQLYQNRRQPVPVLEKTAVASKKARKGKS